MRAMTARLARSGRRGSTHGIVNAMYGVAWFAGRAPLGVPCDRSIPAVAAIALVLRPAAPPAFLRPLRRHAPGAVS